MSTRWLKQLGNTSRFAVRLCFEDDPDGGQGAARDMSLSWGSFQIWVSGKNLCAHREEDETIDSVHWYLLPLLEWLVSSWDPLLHEEQLPVRNAADDAWTALDDLGASLLAYTIDDDRSRKHESQWYAWRQRHALQTCREGGIFPDVVFRRWRDRVEVSWGESPVAGAPESFRFLAPVGVERLEPNEVAPPLFEVVREAVEYLATELPASVRLRKLGERVAAIHAPAGPDRLAWLVGIGDGLSAMRGLTKTILDQASSPSAKAALFGAPAARDLFVPGSCHAGLMFGSASPTLRQKDVLLLAHAIVDAYVTKGPTETPRLRKLVRNEPVSGGARAFAHGYALADALLDDLGVDLERTNRIDVEGIARSLKIELGSLDLTDTNIRAVCMAGPRHRPKLLVNEANPHNANAQGRRFTIAHDLCHLLHDRAAGRELALISGPWAPRATERRANGFAAMLLMPAAIVQRLVGELDVPETSAKGVRALATAMNTSVSTTREHLGNLFEWDEGTRERLRGELVG